MQQAVEAWTELGCRVLSPEDPRVIDRFADFLFVASDRYRAIRAVQGRHLAAVEAADLLWLVCPDGYMGQSASLELGFAIAVGTPVYSDMAPIDLTLRQYVSVVQDPTAALRQTSIGSGAYEGVTSAALLDPLHVAAELHRQVDGLAAELTSPDDPASDEIAARAADQIERLTRIH